MITVSNTILYTLNHIISKTPQNSLFEILVELLFNALNEIGFMLEFFKLNSTIEPGSLLFPNHQKLNYLIQIV